jgi:hypothetical protein
LLLFIYKKGFYFEILVFSPTSSSMLPFALDDPTLETIKKRTEDHNVPEE